MNINRLIYFMSVAKHLNFTKAAAEHNMAQTAMSRHIALLEETLEAQLFERDSRGVRLTPVGSFLYQQLELFLERYHQLMAQVRDMGQGSIGELAIGIGQYEHVLSEKIILEFRRRYPKVSITVSQHLYDELLYKFNNGLLDVVFAFTLSTVGVDMKTVMMRSLCPFIEYIVVQADHPLAGQTYASPADLAKEAFVTLSEEKGPCSFEIFKEYTKRFGFQPARYIKANSLESQLLMVNLGLGISFLPGVCKRHLTANLCTLRLKNPANGDFVVMCRKSSINPATRLFIDHASSIEITEQDYHI